MKNVILEIILNEQVGCYETNSKEYALFSLYALFNTMQAAENFQRLLKYCI